MGFRNKHIIILFLLLIATAFNRVIAQKSLPNNYMVIANDIGKKSISVDELIKVYKGKFNLWSNNEQVVIVLPSSKHESVEVISKFLYNGSKENMMKFWLSLVFQGRANPPYFIENDNSIIDFVVSTPGAIAIIKQNNLPNIQNYSIKIIN